MKKYVIGFRSPKYVVHRDGEDRPVAYLGSRSEAVRWVAVQMLTDMVFEEMDAWDDEIQDVLTEILVDVFHLNIETHDPTDENGSWMRTEDYVLSLFPEAFRRVAERLEIEATRKGLPTHVGPPVSRGLRLV